MGWGISLNRDHLAVWGRWAILWLLFIGFGLIAGWHLSPRLDEIVTVALLPLAVLVPYVLGCLGLAVFRLLWPPLRRALGANQRLGEQARSQTNRRLAH